MAQPPSLRMLVLTVSILLSSVLGSTGVVSGRHRHRHVVWREVRAAIASAICSQAADVGGRTIYYLTFGSREQCGFVKRPSRLDRLIADAFQDARPVLGSLNLQTALYERLQSLPPEEGDRAARDACLGDERFVRSLVRRLEARMLEAGTTCDDCPAFPAAPPRTIAYAELRPYLEAYVWPDEVTDSLDPEGKPTGEKSYGFHICVGLNGLSRIENPDPDLVRAGFVAVSGSPEIMKAASETFHSHLRRPEFALLASDRERTDDLRREVPGEVFSGESLLPVVCDVLARYRDDLGLRVAECR